MRKFFKSWGFFALVLAFCLVGCATNRVDWAARVGSFSLDQAIVELGPPDKQAKLTDGTVVAEWLTRRGRSAVYRPYSGFYGGPGWPMYYGSFFPGELEPGAPDYFLRLTFTADGKLRDWKKFAR